jgi:hypothetical protein
MGAARAQPEAPATGGTGRYVGLKRAGLLAAMTAGVLNVWTGSPLLALWIGSRLQSSSGAPQMAPVFVVAICIGLFSFVLLRILRWLGTRYDELTGRAPTVREHVPWLRSLRGERPHEAGDEYALSALDYLVCVMVGLAIIAFEYWFFFKSGSSIDQRSGR